MLGFYLTKKYPNAAQHHHVKPNPAIPQTPFCERAAKRNFRFFFIIVLC